MADDTFVADRLAAGDRFVLGSLCDHDLYVGIGQPYPHNPNHDDTVDGLLANLAMVDAVTNGTATVPGRATSSLWTVGTSAGAFGAYALTHNLWARASTSMGSCSTPALLVERAVARMGSEWVTDKKTPPTQGPTSPPAPGDLGRIADGDSTRVVGGAEPGQAQAADEVAERQHVGEGLHRPGHHVPGGPPPPRRNIGTNTRLPKAVAPGCSASPRRGRRRWR